MEGCAEREFTEKVLTHIASGLVALTKDLSSFARRTAEGCCPHKGLFQTFNPSRWRVVAQYDSGRLCAHARSPSASLRAGSRPAGENAGLRDDSGEGAMVKNSNWATSRWRCNLRFAASPCTIVTGVSVGPLETVSCGCFRASKHLYEQEVAPTSPQAGRGVEPDFVEDAAQ